MIAPLSGKSSLDMSNSCEPRFVSSTSSSLEFEPVLCLVEVYTVDDID